jgi:catechol 2,3-dioxygenase-like lactoylglutathione lyase family enzyme
MATKPRFGFAVVNVKDIAQAKRFYTEVLGLEVQREAPGFVQFDHFAVATDTPNPKSPTELYWLVDDAEGAHRDLTARGAACSPVETKPFGKLFTLKDPDGHERFVLELAASRPSKPVSA